MRSMLAGLCILLSSFSAFAIENLFEGNSTTSIGNASLGEQPAGLAWLSSKWSFSASATALEQKSYEISKTPMQGDRTPLMIRPMYIATGKGTSWGGFNFQVTNYDVDLRSSANIDDGTTSTNSELRSQFTQLQAALGFGLLLNKHWSLGWALNYGKYTQEGYTISKVQGPNDLMIFSRTHITGENLSTRMGTIMDLDNFRLGISILSADVRMSSKGSNVNSTLNGTTGVFSETTTALEIDTDKTWGIDVGVRLGRMGSAVYLADFFRTNGSHRPTVGYEYRGEWGLWATSLSYQDANQVKNYKWIAGLIQKSENFDWGIGPSIEINSGPENYVNSKTFSLLYASEIRF